VERKIKLGEGFPQSGLVFQRVPAIINTEIGGSLGEFEGEGAIARDMKDAGFQKVGKHLVLRCNLTGGNNPVLAGGQTNQNASGHSHPERGFPNMVGMCVGFDDLGGRKVIVHSAKEVTTAFTTESILEIATNLWVQALDELQIRQLPIGVMRFIGKRSVLCGAREDVYGQIGAEEP
jgi:hypothetical protein